MCVGKGKRKSESGKRSKTVTTVNFMLQYPSRPVNSQQSVKVINYVFLRHSGGVQFSFHKNPPLGTLFRFIPASTIIIPYTMCLSCGMIRSGILISKILHILRFKSSGIWSRVHWLMVTEVWMIVVPFSRSSRLDWIAWPWNHDQASRKTWNRNQYRCVNFIPRLKWLFVPPNVPSVFLLAHFRRYLRESMPRMII